MEEDEEIDRSKHVKLVAVGDAAVGKTCLLLAYARGEFVSTHVPTVFENYAASVARAGLRLVLELVDTAGSETYDRLRPLSYSGADVVLCCYSSTSRESFASVASKWLPELAHFCPDAPVLLVALKTDLREEADDPAATVSAADGAALARERLKTDALFCEASARTRVGLGRVFDTAVDVVMRRRVPERYGSDGLPLSESALAAGLQQKQTRRRNNKRRNCCVL